MVRIQSAPFDTGQEISRLGTGQGEIGATVSFTGVVRSTGGEPVEKLVIEHYPGMTESAIRAMIDEANSRWSLGNCLVIHRYGELYPGEVIMMVAVQAEHRTEAFDAAMFLMDYLKTGAPFWKKELRSSAAAWVGSRAEDEAALAKWKSG